MAAVQFKFADGTYQLHYFITQSEEYFHSRVFSVVLLNWLAPAGLYMGYRHLSLAVQVQYFLNRHIITSIPIIFFYSQTICFCLLLCGTMLVM